MRNRTRLAAASVCLLSMAALGADRAHVKPGLWEFNYRSDANARPPASEDMLARLPPEARARMEAAMQGRGGGAAGGGQPHRQCISDQDLDHPFRADQGREQHCTHKVLAQTSTSMEMAIDCPNLGEHGGTGHGTFKWRAPSPETMSGTIDMVVTQGAQTTTTHATISGQWLGADCGELKPRKKD
jgi:hypothetical protein